MNEQTKVKKKKSLTDKAFMQGIIVCVFNILLCVICLSSATWAWLAVSVESAPATIQPSDYALTIEIKDSKGDLLDYTMVYGRHQFDLPANETYTVKLEAIGSGGNGYAIMFADGVADSWYTNVISLNKDANSTNPISFTISSERDVTLSFDLRWGTIGGSYDIADGYSVTIAEAGVTVVDANEENAEGESSSESESVSETESESASEVTE